MSGYFAPTCNHPHAAARGLRSGGFTLVELVITLAITAILAALAAPSFSGVIAGQRAKGAAADLHVALAIARSEAIKRNSNVSVSAASGGWQNGWTVVAVQDGSTVSTHVAMNGLTIASNMAAITFESSGHLPTGGNSPYFDVSVSGQSAARRCVSVDLSGRPYIAPTPVSSCP